MSPAPARFLTVAEVADLCGMSTRWVQDRYRSGELVASRAGRRVRFDPADVAAFQQSLRQQPKPRRRHLRVA